jgi:hypothetical protein
MMYASSAMDMSSGAEMSTYIGQSGAGADHIVSAENHHSMSAQMDMVRGSLRMIKRSDVNSSAAFGQSEGRSEGLSSCSHETCSQAWASTSLPRASQAQPAYLHDAAIPVSNPAHLITSSHRIARVTPPPTNLAIDLLAALRI